MISCLVFPPNLDTRFSVNARFQIDVHVQIIRS
jgi:hypothetical protein